jgi:hypothetical protein
LNEKNCRNGSKRSGVSVCSATVTTPCSRMEALVEPGHSEALRAYSIARLPR